MVSLFPTKPQQIIDVQPVIEMSHLHQALAARFEDKDEMRDVVNHGCIAGVGDFIYSTELCEFFDKHEEDIENELEAHGLTYTDLLKNPEEFWTMQEVKEAAVWFVVETFCASQLGEDA